MGTEGVRAATAAVNEGSPSPIDEEVIWQMNLRRMEPGAYPDHPANRKLISPAHFEAHAGRVKCLNRGIIFFFLVLDFHCTSYQLPYPKKMIFRVMSGFGEDLLYCDLCPRSFHLVLSKVIPLRYHHDNIKGASDAIANA